MRPVPMNIHMPPPRNVLGRQRLSVHLRTDLEALCERAEILCRVTGGLQLPVVVHSGSEHLRAPDALYVAMSEGWECTRVGALRVLEVLAFAFHDYAARECVCGRGLFVAPGRLGRPTVGPRAMTAAERMRRMRARVAP